MNAIMSLMNTYKSLAHAPAVLMTTDQSGKITVYVYIIYYTRKSRSREICSTQTHFAGSRGNVVDVL